MNTQLRFVSLRAAFFLAWLAASSIATAQFMRAHFLDVGQGSATILEFPCAAIHRTQTGQFASVDDLTKVPGIGAGTIKAIRPFVRTS
jgi:beta-lactamase superfamily II metal-dependent hydrolase